MCSNMNLFASYKPIKKDMLFEANDNSCKIIGVGTIKIKMIDAVVSTLLDVCHLRFEKESYISRCYSIGAMESKRYINLTRDKILCLESECQAK